MENLSHRMVKHAEEIFQPGMMQWRYEHGLLVYTCLEVEPQEAYPWAYAMYDPLIGEDGTIATYREGEFNLDQINAGRNLFALYKRSKEERFLKAADRLHNQLVHQPRTKSGVYWHKEIYPWQIWLDGLYMAEPFKAQYAQLINSSADFDDIIHQFQTVFQTMRDPKTGLLYHCYDESRGMRWSDPVTGLSPHFWGRAMGWYCMACVDVLDYLPADKQQPIKDIMRELIPTILKYQDPSSGMWYQVLDQAGREGNYPETSATSMFVVSMLKAARQGIIPLEQVKEPAKKAFAGMTQRYLSDDDKIGGICAVAGLGGNPYRDGSFAYYISEKVVQDDFKGLGPYILACLEIERL